MFNTQVIPRFDRSRMEAIMKRIKDRRQRDVAKEESSKAKKESSK